MSLALAMALCAGPVRVTCVVDGDTFWLAGEKIRLIAIDAPEITGRCSYERQLAAGARDRLAQLLGPAPLAIERHGHDVYGRTLAAVTAGGRDVGAELVHERLAVPWRGHHPDWCASAPH